MTRPRRDAWEIALYRAAVRLLARRLARAHGEDMVALFRDRLAEVGHRRGARAALLLAAILDALRHGAAARRDGRGLGPHARTGAIADSIRQDVRFTLRSLGRRPLFAAVAVVTLALGIGGATAMFSVVDGVLIRELPYRDPSSLVSVWRAWPSWRGQGLLDAEWDHIELAVSDYVEVRDHARSLTGVEGYAVRHLAMTAEGRAEEVSVGLATGGLFELLGVAPIVGRGFLEDEALPLAARGASVALISHELWTSRFGAEPDILGRTLDLGRGSYQVVGVLPPDFRLTSDMVTTENGGSADAGLRDVWLPLGRNEAECGNCLEVLARLAPGRGIEDARSDVQRLLVERPGDPPGQLARVVPHKARVTQGFGAPLLVLLGGAGVLLLIACLNVAGLLVGEAAHRHAEVAVRSALGAHRHRVVRQLLTEGAVLGVVGATAGVVLAWVGTEALLSIAPPLPRVDELGVNGRALLFALAAGVLTGIGFGLAPALSLLGPRASLPSRGAGRGRRARGLHAVVVSLQVGLTVVLLVAGGLFGRSLGRLLSVEPGFDPEGLASLAFDVPTGRPATAEELARLQAEVVRAAGGVPGVRHVSATSELPFPGGKGARAFALEPDGPMSAVAMWQRSVLPNYHTVMGIPLLAGRLLSETDGPGSPDVIVVSRSFAEQVWPGEGPLGKQIHRTGPEGAWTVVGVVGDVRHRTLGAPPEPTIYRTTAQASSRRLYLVARAGGDPASLIPALQRAIRAVDPAIPLSEAGVMTALVGDAEADDRFRAVLMWTFAAIAVVLTAVGIVGVTARAVSARAPELGIRTALGASPSGLIRLVLTDGLLSSLVGIGLGLVGAAWASGTIRHLLYDVDARDPLTYAATLVFAVAVCLLAAYVPARRIARLDPASAIAEE
jgi:predicted permease